MKKTLFSIVLSTICVSSFNLANATSITSASTNPTMVGGWYPVFFETFDKSRLDKMIASSKSGNISKVIISFDNNNALANQINDYFINNSTITPQMNYEPTHDSPTVQYEHSKVVLTVYSK